MPVPVAGAHSRSHPSSEMGATIVQEAPVTESPARRRKAKKQGTKKPAGTTLSTAATAGPSSLPESSPWAWTSVAESSASRVPPVLTKDGSYFFSALGSAVKIYSARTGQVVSTLDAASTRPSSSEGEGDGSSNSHITSMILNPHNPYQLITSSLGGYLRIWDFLDATLLQTLNLAQPILHVAAHQKFADAVFVAALKPGKKLSDDSAVILRVSLIPTKATATSPIQTSSSVSGIGKTRATTGLGLSSSGSWLVATAGHKAYVCSTSKFDAGFTKFVSPQQLTCIAFHPSEDYFATGDVTGCIRLWYCLNDNIPVNAHGVEKTAQTTTLHWHSHAVSSLAFTSNGSYILSGGEEAVLVIWQLHSARKEFVPRVGAPIVHVALTKSETGEEEYLLGLSDSSFAFVRSGTLKVSKAIARVKLDPSSSAPPSSSIPLAVHSPTSTYILPSSHPSSLQIFNPSTLKLVAELEVSPSNRVSRKDEKPLEPSRVERSVVSSSGEWMATIDSRAADESFHGEVYLKIWQWDRLIGAWTLNTRVDRPHGLKPVSTVAFSPSDDSIFATTGEDGNIKTWRLRSTKTKTGNTESFWVTRSTLRFRNETPSDVCWSPDGSLYVVCVGLHIVAYDARTDAVCAVLASPDCRAISSANFVGVGGRYVATISGKDLMIWDFASQSMRWHHHSANTINRVVAHPYEDTFAVFEQSSSDSTVVQIFSVSSSMPVASKSLPFKLRAVLAHPSLFATAKDTASFSLLGISESWAVVLFGDEVHIPVEEGASAQSVVAQTPATRRTLFQDIFGQSAFEGITPYVASSAITDRNEPWRGKEVQQAFSAPAYLMPPIDTLFDPLMDEFLALRSVDAEINEEEKDEQQEEDNEMDVDERPIVVGSRVERVVDEAEMNALIELFKQHAIKRPPPSHMATQQVNGLPQLNGVPRPKANGAPAAAAAPVSATVQARKSSPAKAHAPVGAAAVPTQLSSPVVTGKKRKKSLS